MHLCILIHWFSKLDGEFLYYFILFYLKKKKGALISLLSLEEDSGKSCTQAVHSVESHPFGIKSV